MMKRETWTKSVLAGGLMALVAAGLGQFNPYSWRYYRPGNTGIQGDFNEAIWVAPDGDPWIGGYDPSFEEGGIAKFIQTQNRWVNVSNVDHQVIGHPENTGTSRVADIDIDANGNMWMATGRGGLFYNPSAGPSSLRRFGADNSPIPGGWNRGVEVAPDGTIWFSAYSTVWGDGGVSRYNPATNAWQVYPTIGDGHLAIQPKPGGGYYVWATTTADVHRFDSATNGWSNIAKVDGNPAYLIGNNLTDDAGNTWMYKWTNAVMSEARLDLRRPDGTWMNVPTAPFDQTAFNSAAGLRAQSSGQALVVDGGGTVYRFNGVSWINLGVWNATTYSYDVDSDAQGNVWACGIGGAAKRNAATGAWQRYRITNTSQYELFANDLTLGTDGTVFATANAGPGYGGMVAFDGIRWTGYNNHHYGLGFDWPFPTDNSSLVYKRPSSNQLVANPMFNGLHRYNGGASWTSLNVGVDTVEDVVEDSTGRLWATYYGHLRYLNGSSWVDVNTNILGEKLVRDPIRPGGVIAMGWTSIVRTDGTTTQVWNVEDFPMLDPQSDQFKGIAVTRSGIIWIGAYTVNLPDNSTVIRLDPRTGSYTTFRRHVNWPFPGEYAMPLAATNDNRIWFQYDSDYLTAQRGMFSYDTRRVVTFPAPAGGEPQWGGLPHASIADCEVRYVRGGYELWLSTKSRGISVLKVRTFGIVGP